MSRTILFGVSSNEAGWQAAIHTVVHRIGRHFGFQAFNPDPRNSQGLSEPVWTPATIFLVTDHLYHLLVKNYMRRDSAAGSDDDRFGRAVFRLHDAIFQGYRDWCTHVELPRRVKELELESLQKYGTVVEWEYLLEELALYFLIYSEGANLRHMPEAMWFVFWLLRNSRDKFNQITSPAPTDPRSAAFASHSNLMRGLMKKRCHLRKKYHAQIQQWRNECGIKGDGDCVPVADLVRAHAYARAQATAAELFPADAVEIDLLAELVSYGDSGPFLERMVSPVFGFLAIQVDRMGTSGREIAHRIAYDDCNESLCSKEVVHKVLGMLGIKWEKTGRIIIQADPYDALLAVGQVSLNVASGVVGTVSDDAECGGKGLGDSAVGVRLGWDWKAAREWWGRFVFGKTYVERRSIFTMYRTFYRVWAFFILEFHVMAVLLWGWGNFYALTSVCLSHAALSLLEQMAGAWTQRAPVKGLRVWGNPFWGRFSKGILDWLAINTVMWLALVAQITDFFKGVSIWYYVAMGYTGLVVGHAVLSTRDGHAISISHSLSAKFRRWARTSTCCSWLWTALAWFWSRVGASSARPPPREYLAPYQMKVGWDDFLSNVVFWSLVLAAKFAFDWFAVMRTLEAPILGLWNRGWLNTGSGNIIIGGKDTHIPKPDGDIILCIARCMPGFIIMFNDTQIFYYLVMSLFGAVKGLVQLNLGNITSFQELVVTFHKAPFRWWEAGMSRKGAANILNAIDSASTISSAPQTIPPPLVGGSSDTISDMMRQRALDRQKLSYTERLIQTTQDMAKNPENKQVRSYFSDDNIARWLVFSDVWNAIVDELRSVDLISDSERDNLAFVHLDIDESIEIVDGMRPFMLPIFFYGGQINRALEVPGIDSGQHVALTEIRALLVWLLLQLGVVDKEQSEAMLHFHPLERPSTLEHRTKRVEGVSEVVKFLKNLQSVQAVVDEHPWGPNSPSDVNPGRVMNGQAIALKKALESLQAHVLDPWQWSAFIGEQGGLSAIYHEADDSASKRCIGKVVRHVLKMLETSAKGAQPRGEEAQRVLSFFMASLKNPTLDPRFFMQNTPPCVEEMLSFNTLTPHYEEDVVYALNSSNVAKHFSLDATAARGLSDLVRENEDGLSVMQWLKSAYPRDWHNLLERLKPKLNGLDPRHVTEDDFDVGGPLHHVQMELLLWASYRGQLLSRTVRGMMAYENAVRLLAHLENPKPMGMSDVKYESLVEDLVRSKFTYVVASQVYAANRSSNTARGRWLARGVDLLLHQHPGLRVAYLDTQYAETGSQQYGVLIRGRIGIPASDPNCTEELYRIRLPQNRETGHGVILGEGKPENQNAAIIFCFGEIVQAIDMNQDNYLCEALKMRNLVSEFNPPHYNNQAEVGAAFTKANEVPQPLKTGTGRQQVDVLATVTRLGGAAAGHAEKPWPDMRNGPVCLVGFREYVFSQDSGALASFAAATEFTFGSMVQRVMCWPNAVRFHYGHPDLWNKLFVMSRGGVSKATRAFHISEDVFAGYNHTLRGGKTKFKEYISVGKGRDMGFDSINSFESKVAGGNGEQVMSRDVHRLGTQFDFFRLLAFYQSGPGFYINTYLVMLSVYANVWVLLLLALTDSQLVVDPRTNEVVSSLTGQADAVSIQQIVQLGMFSIVTYAVELVLEWGLVKSVATIFVQLLQGSLAFFIFRSRTSAYYFKNDVQYGGAKYIPTGRGYAIKHNSFVKVYTTYARSHLYFATELVVMLVLLALISIEDYAITTWSTWMVAVCILWSPFWFNPQTFQLERCKDDFEGWMLWMTDVTEPETKSTWYSWNKAQLEKSRNENLSQTNPYATALRGVLSSLPTAILGVAAISSMDGVRWNKWAVFGVATGGFWALVITVLVVRSFLLKRFKYRIWRLLRTLLVGLLIAFLVCLIIFVPEAGSAGLGFKNIFKMVFANFEMVVVFTQLLLYLRRGSLNSRYVVDSAYRVMDWAIGYFLFGILFLLSFLQVFDLVQGAMLFNMKFSKALQRSRLLEANYLSSYVDRAMERIGKQVKEETMGSSGGSSRQQAQHGAPHKPPLSPGRAPGSPTKSSLKIN